MSAPVNIERGAIGLLASNFDLTADALAATGTAIGHCGFRSASAGRAYAEAGAALQTGYATAASAVQDWTLQARCLAEAFRAAAAGYSGTDANTADGLSGPPR
ncbi:type VII secretion target [Rhodococcus sp. X156]|uniref:type VII secretion target n=1 Tax=Rhodococcus sp. X156 TaxID=2499145 RepID=UPI000FD79FB5|nr:type VII secretion target [Rhodococcus sp. X156]